MYRYIGWDIFEGFILDNKSKCRNIKKVYRLRIIINT